MSSPSASDIIPKLKFIAKLKKGDKIYVKNLYIQPNNLIYRMLRSFYHIDDRTNTLVFIQTTITKGFELFQENILIHSPFHARVCQNIFQDLRNTKDGLLCLKETYVDDVMFSCKIDALIEDTEAKLVEIENRYDLTQLFLEQLKSEDTKEEAPRLPDRPKKR